MSDVVNREEILGASKKSYSFDKAIRGYEPKQVDDFINNLIVTNKSAAASFDERIKDLNNEREMLESELSSTKGEVESLRRLLEQVRAQRDELEARPSESVTSVLDTEKIKELEEKLEKSMTNNRLLNEENKKLQEQNRDLQRDVAHLTKKVDKNRSKISELTDQVESGMQNEEDKKYSEVAQIYESAIDKAEDIIYRLQTELSLAHSKAEDIKGESK